MKNKKTIIGINASYLRKPNTGIGQVTANFIKKLANSKIKEIEFVLYLEENLPKDFKLPKNFSKKVFLPIWKRDDLIRKIWWEKYSLPKKVKKDKCDIFISMYQCPTVFKTPSVLNSGHSVSLRHIMVVHDIIPKLFPEYLDNFRKKIYWNYTEKGIKNTDKIIAVSKKTEKDLIAHLGINADKITTNYIDVDEIYKNVGAESASSADKHGQAVLKKYKLKPGYIFAGGGYEKRKNIESVVRAYKILLEKNKKEHFVEEFPRLVIYGKILPKNLSLATDAQKLVKELNLTKQVRLLGMTPQKDLPALFKGAIMFAYPSFYEGFGMPVLEAMSVGTPVVTSKISSLPEVGGDSVLYCNPNDISDIAMVMKNILTNKDLREQLKFHGREKAKQFSWEKFTEKVLNIINAM
ncbi:MAG TPA: glycosyltransferase family 1 protein [Candidatus Moranbacteria bacterium]|nr:glycosyltransferase family 1 protein [Candidatus Moranbacteria bacterium]